MFLPNGYFGCVEGPCTCGGKSNNSGIQDTSAGQTQPVLSGGTSAAAAARAASALTEGFVAASPRANRGLGAANAAVTNGLGIVFSYERQQQIRLMQPSIDFPEPVVPD